MNRLTFALLLSLTSIAACSGGSEAAPDTDAPTDTSGAPSDECVLGHERCACMAGACLEGLVCLSDLCVAPAADETSSTDASTGVTTLGDGSTSDTPSDASTSEDPTAETTNSDTSTDDESSSDDGTTTGAPDPVCLQGDNYCDDGMFQSCDDEGQWAISTCQEQCALVGYDSTGCASHDACACDGFIDDFCYDALFTLCVCNSNVYQCDDDQVHEFYDLCIQGHEVLLCFGMYPYVSQQATCGPANAACL